MFQSVCLTLHKLRTGEYVAVPGSFAELSWLPPAMLGAMQRIGAVGLIGGATAQLVRFKALLATIADVHASKVDPSLTLWPLGNNVIPACYRNEDFIPWDRET